MDQYINIGYTKKVYGVKGEIKIHVESKYLEDFLKADIAFIELAGKQVPYFIESLHPAFPIIGKFEDINSREEALDIVAKKVFLRSSDLIPAEERTLPVEAESLQYKVCEGFMMLDINAGKIGKIKEVLEYPQQEMALVAYKGKEILIPMNDQLIVKINEAEKLVEVDLPEGLLSL